MSLRPSFGGDEYKIVKVLIMPLRGENEVFSFVIAFGSIMLLTNLRFAFRKSSNMAAFMVSPTRFHSNLCVLLSCALQVMYADCSATVLRRLIKY